MTDIFTERTTSSWSGNIGGSLLAALIGFLMFVGAFPLELWNESRAINQERALQEGEKSVISITAQDLTPEHEGKLVHITGKATTKEQLQDQDFGIKVNALKLNRAVQMYQWTEETSTTSHDKLGGGTETITEYRYDPAWSEALIDSNSFRHPSGHANPSSFEFGPLKQQADVVSLGKFSLESGIVNKIPVKTFRVDVDAHITNLPAARSHKLHVQDGHFYVGSNPSSPSVGDEKISFEFAPIGDYSVVAKQEQNRLVAYTASNGNSIELVQAGDMSAEEMFKVAERENAVITWMLRVTGVLLMFGGMVCMASPIRAIFGVIPFVGNLAGFSIVLFAIPISLTLSLVTIAIGWIAFRPMVAFSLIAIAVVLTLLSLKMRRAS